MGPYYLERIRKVNFGERRGQQGEQRAGAHEEAEYRHTDLHGKIDPSTCRHDEVENAEANC